MGQEVESTKLKTDQFNQTLINSFGVIQTMTARWRKIMKQTIFSKIFCHLFSKFFNKIVKSL